MAATKKTMTQICNSLASANGLIFQMRLESAEMFDNHYEVEEFSQGSFAIICKATIWKLRDYNTSAEFTDKVNEAVERINRLNDYTWRQGFCEDFTEKFHEIDELNHSIFFNVEEFGRRLFDHEVGNKFYTHEKDVFETIVEKFLADSENDLFDLQIVIEGASS